MVTIKSITEPFQTEKSKKQIRMNVLLEEISRSLWHTGKLNLILLGAEIQPQRILAQFVEGCIELHFKKRQVRWASTNSGGFQEQERTKPLYLITDEPTHPAKDEIRNPTLDFRSTPGVSIEFKSEQPVTTLVLMNHGLTNDHNWLRLDTHEYFYHREYNQIEITFRGYPYQVTVSINGKTIFYDIIDI
jgi:hypothetical protein